jgi:hypothetical protein
MHNDISSELQRSLEIGGQESVVHHQQDILSFVANLSNPLDVNQFQSRVGWSLNPNKL